MTQFFGVGKESDITERLSLLVTFLAKEVILDFTLTLP